MRVHKGGRESMLCGWEDFPEEMASVLSVGRCRGVNRHNVVMGGAGWARRFQTESKCKGLRLEWV